MSKLLIAFLTLFYSASSFAEVTKAQLTSAVENRQPVDNLQDDVVGKTDIITKVYFFTRISTLGGKQISHRWFYQGQLQAEVPLNIGSDSWRTYSSKRIKPDWQGDWQVQVWHEQEMLLSHDFTFRLYQPQ